MSLKDTITSDMKDAMRAKETARLGTIRLLLSAMKQKEVDERLTLTDEHIVAILDKLIKQRKDSITQFEAAQRTDLVEKERFELEVISAYLPQQADAAQIAAEIDSVLAGLGATGPQDMGRVMAQLKSRLAGRADLSAVSAQVKARLSGPQG